METEDLKARQITRTVEIENADGTLISRKEELILEHARHWLEPDEDGESVESGIILYDGERIVANLERIGRGRTMDSHRAVDKQLAHPPPAGETATPFRLHHPRKEGQHT